MGRGSGAANFVQFGASVLSTRLEMGLKVEVREWFMEGIERVPKKRGKVNREGGPVSEMQKRSFYAAIFLLRMRLPANA